MFQHHHWQMFGRKLINVINFHSVEVVGCSSLIQLQTGENWDYLI